MNVDKINEADILSKINGLTAKFQCQYCDNIQEMNVFPYINFSKNPEYYAKVKNLDIFKNICNKCKKVNYIQYDIFIIDETHKYFLYLLTDKSQIDTFNNQISYFINTNLNDNLLLKTNEIKTRLVVDINQLIEKMTIFELGLDDKVIELIKSAIIDKGDAKIGKLFFDEINETNLIFIHFINNKEINKISINYNIYNDSLEKISLLEKTNETSFPLIDYNWIKNKILK